MNENILVDLTEGRGDWKILMRRCINCGFNTYFKLTISQHKKYVVNGEHVQDVFPEVGKEWRETIISGTHPECWNEMMGIEEE